MKIRIKGNSIRYRLSRTEVETFCTKGSFSEKTLFNTKPFHYKIKALEGIENLGADFGDDTITLYFPDSWRNVWANTEIVGYQHKMILANGKELLLLVEKDFVCLDIRDEDQSDNYPNPKAS